MMEKIKNNKMMSRYTEKHIRLLEVQAKSETSWYYVTLRHYQNLGKDEVEYFKDWVEWDGEKWLYEEYVDCYVCVIHKEEDK